MKRFAAVACVVATLSVTGAAFAASNDTAATRYYPQSRSLGPRLDGPLLLPDACIHHRRQPGAGVAAELAIRRGDFDCGYVGVIPRTRRSGLWEARLMGTGLDTAAHQRAPQRVLRTSKLLVSLLVSGCVR